MESIATILPYCLQHQVKDNLVTWWSYHKNVAMTIDGSERVIGAK
jgi:hypothetical protein